MVITGSNIILDLHEIKEAKAMLTDSYNMPQNKENDIMGEDEYNAIKACLNSYEILLNCIAQKMKYDI